jgi:tetratricopeptide (TPR) repeat protein
MAMQEGRGGLRDPGAGAAARQRHQRAHHFDLLGDSHNGLGRHEAAIEAYQQAAQGFREQGAQCSYALCLLKIADSYLSLAEPWHAVGYLEACQPLLHDLGLMRHEALALDQLARCRARLAEAHLPGEGRAGQRSGRSRSSRPSRPSRPACPDDVADAGGPG